MEIKQALSRTGTVQAKPGDRLLPVVLPATDGRAVNLMEEVARQHLVLFFYPGDGEGLRYPELRGCTPEACSFRDNVAALRRLGAQVFGVSLQPTERQRAFVEREHLSFPLLSDQGRQLVTALGIPLWRSSAGEEFCVRTTVVVEAGGRVDQVFADVRVDGHVDAVIATVRHLTTVAG